MHDIKKQNKKTEMKKEMFVYTTIYLTAIILLTICLSTVYRKTHKQEAKIKQQKEQIDEYQNRQFKLENTMMTLLTYDDISIPKNTILQNECGDSINIEEVFNTSQCKFVMRLSKHTCINCVLSFHKIINEYNINDNEIVYITDYETKEEQEFYKKMLNIKSKIYIIRDFKLPIEEEGIFYTFTTNNSLSIQKLFAPMYDFDSLSRGYMNIIEKALRNKK
mgnify:CR=1 FL=1